MRSAVVCGSMLLLAVALHATIFGTIRGLIHDPQHRPVQGAEITVRSKTSDWTRTITTNDQGEFQLDAVPLGFYEVSVGAPGFTASPQAITLTSGAVTNLHFQLAVAAPTTSITVSAQPEQVNPDSSTPTTVISHQQITRAPGAERTNSMSMITDFVPGTYIVHDQLHFRGGHQVTWQIDGVPVPNTNIASNVGPQFDPKDIATIEVQRGGYSAEYGDRTYGVLNVATRSGFERNNEGELVVSYGSFNQTDDQISFGSHTQRFAYYASLSGNRADLGLETPEESVLHDQAAGLSGFVSLIFNRTPADQLRLVASVRGDHYQVPNTFAQQASGIRDVEDERDDFVNFSWVHTAAGGVSLTVSPFYHFNRAHYIGGPSDTPLIPEDDRGSNYAGGVASLAVVRGKHNARLGMEGFAQHDNQFLSLQRTSPVLLHQERDLAWGSTLAGFIEDQYKLASWLSLNGGLRLTRFSGPREVTENIADPRAGAAIQIPHLGWVLRGFYGRFYQPPPLLTLSGPILDFAVDQGFTFQPLRGERDEQYDAGVSIPLHGWTLEADNFRTGAKNYLDHDVLGNSNIFFPLTLQRARIKGTEISVRSPRLAGRAQLHLAYSRQFAQWKGNVTGGLTGDASCFLPAPLFCFLDHDQRDTLTTGFNLNLPSRAWAAGNLSLGSGFLNGDGPGHLPSHATFDLSLGRSFGERWSMQLSALNISNSRYLLDNSNTFGGTHYSYPREFAVQVKYRFHY